MNTSEYVRCIDNSWWKNTHIRITVGKIYEFPIITDDRGQTLDVNPDFSMWTNEFTTATEEEWNKQEEIIKELIYQIY